jgi:hypothetical protein
MTMIGLKVSSTRMITFIYFNIHIFGDAVAFSITWKSLREARENLELVWMVDETDLEVDANAFGRESETEDP